jgi:hypothetical protein
MAALSLAAAVALVAVTSARPVAIAAAGGDRVAVAYSLLGRSWLVLRGAPGPGALPVPLPLGPPPGLPPVPAPVTLASAHLAGAPGLYAVAGGEVRAYALPNPGARWPRPRLLAAAPAGPDPVRQALAADLDGDGADELLLIRGDAEPLPPGESRPGLGGRVEVWQVRDGALHLAWQGMEKYRPWQLAAGDLDGDGTTEWAAGLWTKAVYDPRWAERPWVYGWKNGEPFARWLGSRLAHPFTDFTLSPLGPGEPAALVAVEAAREGGQTLSIYRWNGFGFTLEQAGPAWEQVLAFAALPPVPGCPALAAVVKPGPALVLLERPADLSSPLKETARQPLPGSSSPTLAVTSGHLWLLDNDRLSRISSCPGNAHGAAESDKGTERAREGDRAGFYGRRSARPCPLLTLVHER